jgi:hypothetical protein
MKNRPEASWESDMPTDQQDNNRPDPTPSDSTWVPSPAPAKPDRPTYEASRRVELEPDPPSRYQNAASSSAISVSWESMRSTTSERISPDDKEEHNKVESELYLSHRVLVHTVELSAGVRRVPRIDR